jgi:hypothetical protein
MQPEITHTTELDYQDYIYTVTVGNEIFLEYKENTIGDFKVSRFIHFGAESEMIAVAKAMLEAAGVSVVLSTEEAE